MYTPLTAEDYQESILVNGKRILNSHSRGGGTGRQCSPLIAKLACGQELERIYQGLKITATGQRLTYRPGKDDLTTYTGFLFRNGFFLPNVQRNEVFHMLYYALFEEQPDLFAQVLTFDGARDRFDTQGGIPFLWEDTPNEVVEGERCNQARSIAWCVNARPLTAEMQEQLLQYWNRYHTTH